MKKTNQAGISVFFPCYNDSKSIQKLIDDVFMVLPKFSNKYEVIVIDDGSSDSSKKVLKKLAKKFNRLKLIFHEKNQGYGGALISGFKAAKFELIFYTDGDGQYDVKELPILLSLMSDDVNFVNGIKMTRHDPSYRIFLGNLYSFLARWLFWLPVIDVDCDFRLIRGSLIKRIDLKNKSGTICIELVKKCQRNGGKFRQVSVHHLERKYGSSQFFRLNHLIKTFWELGTLWFQLMILKDNGKIRV
jgi:glycosyltransferase involved in cell wall biosynthesis